MLKNDLIKNEDRYLMKGEIEGVKGNYEKAKEYFEKVIKITDKKEKLHIIARYLIKVMYLNKGFKKYLSELNKKYIDLLKKGDRIGAYYVAEKLVKLDPTNPRYRLKLAQSGIMINAPQVSYIASRKVIDLKPVNKRIYYSAVVTLGYALRDYYDLNRLDLDHAIDPGGLIKLLSSNGNNFYANIMGTADLENAVYELGKVLKSKDVPKNIKRQANALMKQLMNKIEFVRKEKNKRDL